jgi:hypothetical protein
MICIVVALDAMEHIHPSDHILRGVHTCKFFRSKSEFCPKSHRKDSIDLTNAELTPKLAKTGEMCPKHLAMDTIVVCANKCVEENLLQQRSDS